MRKYRVWYDSASYYSVDVEAESADEAKQKADVVVEQAENRVNSAAVNEMYDKHYCDRRFRYKRTVKI